MDSEHWMSRLMAAKRQYALQRAQNHHATAVPHLDFPCPYCYEDHNITSLCAHLEDEHPFESKVVACPVCSARISKDLLDHITLQHGYMFKISFFEILRRVAVPSNHALSLGGRDLQETYLKVLLGNNNRSSGTSAASSVTDSLLSSLVLSLSSPEAEDTAKSSPSKTWKASRGNVQMYKECIRFDMPLTLDGTKVTGRLPGWDQGAGHLLPAGAWRVERWWRRAAVQGKMKQAAPWMQSDTMEWGMLAGGGGCARVDAGCCAPALGLWDAGRLCGWVGPAGVG
ncbi:hypothetical protein ABZP36_033007 [Zizania latifolia]